MNDKKELDINNEELTAEETPVCEAVAEENKEISAKEEFISEFAPEPIKIPKYNKEKEKIKAQKANAKKKKLKSKKARKRRKLVRKILTVLRTILFFVLLVAVVTVTLTSLMVKMNTTEYSIETAIRSSNPENYVIGKIQHPEKINLKLSSSKASVADVLRDNSLILVTYDDIKTAVDESSYPSFVGKIAHNVVNYYVFGEELKKVKATDISNVLYENASYIKYVTGIELGESACDEMAKYIAKSSAVKELSKENLSMQKAKDYTPVTKIMFSTTVLIILVIALMLLLVLSVVYCKGFWHKIIGGAIIIAGIISGVAGFLFKPSFSVESEFVKNVVSAVVKNFNNSSVIFASVAVLVGVLVLLIGRAVSDDDDEYEIEYIEQ